jgi:hypothetical protein
MPLPVYLTAAVTALDAHAEEYDTAAAYYEGTVAEVITSRRLRQMFGNLGLDQFRINYARTPVDVLLERTQIQGINCSDAGSLKLLDTVWAANQLGLEAKDIHRRAFEFGDSYVIGWPDDEIEGGVALYAHDPRSVRVFYDPQRPRVKSHAIHRWIEAGDEENGLGEGLWTRVNLYFGEYVEQWVSQNRVDGVQGQLTLTADGEPDLVPLAIAPVVENPTPGVIPVFHFRTARPYGRPEHADAYGPQNMLTKLCTTMMVAVDYAGYPQRYVTTDSALSPSAPTSDAFGLPPEGSLSPDEGLDDASEMEAGPGSTWLLSGQSIKVGQFSAAETQNFLNAVHSIIKQMSAVTDVPLHYFDRTGDMPSGESFRMSEQPLIRKEQDRQAQLGITWHELYDYCLLVNGMAPSDALPIWAPANVWTDLNSWQTAVIQLNSGVPYDQVLRERGYGEDLIAEWAAQGLDQVHLRELPPSTPAEPQDPGL